MTQGEGFMMMILYGEQWTEYTLKVVEPITGYILKVVEPITLAIADC